MMRRWASPAAMLFLCSLGTTAAAESPRHTLRETIQVNPGITCIDEEALRQQIRAWLETDAVEGDLRVEVEGSNRDARDFSFRMWESGHLIAYRRFAPGPAECAQIHAVLGLAIALAVKVSLRDEVFGQPVPRRSSGWSLGAGVSAAWNVVPGVAAGGFVSVEKSLPEHFAAHLELSGLAGWGDTFKGVAGEFTTSTASLAAGICATPTLSRAVRGRLCVALEARAFLASGSGFSISKDAVLDWFSVSNSLGVAVEVAPRWALVGAVGLVVPLEKSQIVVSDPAGRVVDTRDSAAAGGVLSLGGAYEF